MRFLTHYAKQKDEVLHAQTLVERAVCVLWSDHFFRARLPGAKTLPTDGLLWQRTRESENEEKRQPKKGERRPIDVHHETNADTL